MSDESEIRKIIDYYHEGHVQNKPELYDEVFHDDWRFFFYNSDGEFQIVDKETYKSWYNPDEKDEELEWHTEILSIDITEHNAAVKLKIGNQKVEFTDYFNMMKIDGKWCVVNKISSANRFE
jgi:hypothetical protein